MMMHGQSSDSPIAQLRRSPTAPEADRVADLITIRDPLYHLATFAARTNCSATNPFPLDERFHSNGTGLAPTRGTGQSTTRFPATSMP